MEIPYEVTPRRDTGLFNAKLGIWLFLASEVMLFGGLFSAYVFLRVGIDPGVDNPWPWGVNVQNVTLGFINTLVLILSSVFVVFAWIALKERKWRTYQTYMYSVVLCAVIFMCIKGYEYNQKLNHHYGVKLTDNSVLEGKLIHGSDRIRFDGQKVSLRMSGSIPAFLNDLRGDEFPVFKVEGTETTLKSKSELKKWFLTSSSDAKKGVAKARKGYRADLRAFNLAEETQAGSGTKARTVADRLKEDKVALSAVLVADKAFKVAGNPRKVAMHTEKAIAYKDGVSVEGKLIDDSVQIEVHQVDMQLVLPIDQDGSMVWKLIGEEGKAQFMAEQKEDYEAIAEYYQGREKIIPEKMLRGYVLNLQDVHLGGHHDEKADAHHDEKAAHDEKATDDKHAAHDEKASHDGHADHDSHGHAGEVSIPRDQIKFMSSHGPRYGTYYAIYFTMTALHGLHVIGGALVLLFFTVFGRKLYDKNPEHLANRVEVGGLFWHFVDLIWIFLFPLMYLL